MYAFWRAEAPVTEYEQRVLIVDDAQTTFTDKGVGPDRRFLESGYIGIQTRHQRDADRGQPQSIRFSVWNAKWGKGCLKGRTLGRA